MLAFRIWCRLQHFIFVLFHFIGHRPGQRTSDKGQRTKDKGQKTKDRGKGTKDTGDRT